MFSFKMNDVGDPHEVFFKRDANMGILYLTRSLEDRLFLLF